MMMAAATANEVKLRAKRTNEEFYDEKKETKINCERITQTTTKSIKKYSIKHQRQ